MTEKLSILNPYPRRIPGSELLHELVSNGSVESCIAIEYLSPNEAIERLSYSDLRLRSDVLAHRILSAWQRHPTTSIPERFIAPIFIQQCPDLYVSELAALKAGAAFCPIALDVPEERLRFILNDIDAKFILTTTQLSDSLPALEGIEIICVDYCPRDIDDSPLALEIVSSQPAYIMYTSGSTGLPKGVVVSHSAATQALLAHDGHIPPFSRFLQFASPTFDVSVFEIFFPLFKSCTVVCGSRRQLLNDLPGFIEHMGVDAAELTPSVVSSLLRNRASVPSLKVLLTIGEMLKRDVVEAFGAHTDADGVLCGLYGPTEAAIHCTVQPQFSSAMSINNIGMPLDTVSTFVVRPTAPAGDLEDPNQILPIGEEGELVVGGYQLADGYLNRPEQTRSSFFQHDEYGTLYRTGDRARLTRDGTLECLGRISSGQVKLRGQVRCGPSNTLLKY